MRTRDGNKCVVCGSTKFVQAHHVFPKERYPELRLTLENGISLCATHHKFGKYSAHLNPFWFSAWCDKNLPRWFRWWVVNVIGCGVCLVLVVLGLRG